MWKSRVIGAKYIKYAAEIHIYIYIYLYSHMKLPFYNLERTRKDLGITLYISYAYRF